MNDVERRLADLGESARLNAAGPLRPRPEALRRIRLRRGLISGAAALSVAAVVAGGIGLADLPGGEDDRRPPPAATPSPEDGPAERNRCRIAFAPTYLPAGIDAEPRRGSGGSDDVAAAEEAGIIGHFRGPRGTYIDVLDTAPPTVPTNTRRIRVFGAPAILGTIHEGYSLEFRAGRCEYSLAGYGVTRSELRRFATRLTRVAPPPSGAPGIVIWPEDTLADAEAGCADSGPRERTAPAIVWSFVTDVLGWSSPLVEAPGRRSDAWTVKPLGGDTYGGEVEAGVAISVTEVIPGCWSVASVSRLPDRRPTGLGVSIRGRDAEIGFDPLGAASASIEIGYGSATSRRAFVRWEKGEPLVRIPLPFDPDTTGSLLILLEDGDGDVFTAYGTPLPDGDFAAG